jgi:hypothetical protein
LGVVFAAALSANAAPINITAEENATANKSAPDTVQTGVMRVKSDGDNDYSRIAYLRFDVSSLVSAKSIGSAELALDVTLQEGGTINIYALNDGVTGESTWGRDTLTWNTRPDGTGNVPNSKLRLLTSNKVSTTGVVTFDLTDDLPALLAADTDGKITLALAGSSSKDQTIFSELGSTTGAAATLNVSTDVSTDVILNSAQTIPF